MKFLIGVSITALVIIGLTVFNSPTSIADTLTGTADDDEFTGTIKDASNKKGIRIRIEGPSGRFTRVTDDKGEFSFPLRSEGDHTLTINNRGNITRVTIYIEKGKDIEDQKF